MKKELTAVSLFCSGGIGDLALQKAGINVIVANELLEDRASLFEYNFPSCNVITGDINLNKSEIINLTKKILNGKELDFLIATPPCQGMSSNVK
jgi:DNA (cytosine-5)-methyltransferase 1